MRKHVYWGFFESSLIGTISIVLSLGLAIFTADDDVARDSFLLMMLFWVIFMAFIGLCTVIWPKPQVLNLGPATAGLLKNYNNTLSIEAEGVADDLMAIRTSSGTYLLEPHLHYIAYPDGSVWKAGVFSEGLQQPLEVPIARLAQPAGIFEQRALQPFVGKKILGLKQTFFSALAAALIICLVIYWNTLEEMYLTHQIEQASGVRVLSIKKVNGPGDNNTMDVSIAKGRHTLSFERLSSDSDDLNANIQIAAMDDMYLYDSMAFLNPTDEECLKNSDRLYRSNVYQNLDIGAEGPHRALVNDAKFTPVDIADLCRNAPKVIKWLEKVPAWPKTYSYLGHYYEPQDYYTYTSRPKLWVRHYLFKSPKKRNIYWLGAAKQGL